MTTSYFAINLLQHVSRFKWPHVDGVLLTLNLEGFDYYRIRVAILCVVFIVNLVTF